MYNIDSYDYLLFVVTRYYPIVLHVRFQFSFTKYLDIVINDNVKVYSKGSFLSLILYMTRTSVVWHLFVYFLIFIDCNANV